MSETYKVYNREELQRAYESSELAEIDRRADKGDAGRGWVRPVGWTERLTVEEARKRFDVSRILRRFGTWAVTTYGVECLTMDYFFEKVRVGEADWLCHMTEKNWVNMADFKAALLYARQRFGVQLNHSTGAKHCYCGGNRHADQY